MGALLVVVAARVLFPQKWDDEGGPTTVDAYNL